MIVIVKKLWQGHASVRDYLVKKAIKAKEDLVIKLITGEKKTYPYKSLKGCLVNLSKVEFRSSFTGKKYYLIDFPWSPPPQIYGND